MNKKENIVQEKVFNFGVRIFHLYKHLSPKKEFVLAKQILRSGTSIGANIEEAEGGVSTADFSFKISIAYKESRETQYWLKFLYKVELIDEKMFQSLFSDCDEISRILFSILKKTRVEKVDN